MGDIIDPAVIFKRQLQKQYSVATQAFVTAIFSFARVTPGKAAQPLKSTHHTRVSRIPPSIPHSWAPCRQLSPTYPIIILKSRIEHFWFVQCSSLCFLFAFLDVDIHVTELPIRRKLHIKLQRRNKEDGKLQRTAQQQCETLQNRYAIHATCVHLGSLESQVLF